MDERLKDVFPKDSVIKESFKIEKGSKPDKFIDYFAKKDLKGLLGFDHDVKYK